MAISVKELGRKAEDLIEKGRDADKQVQMCQSRVAQASSQVAEARRQIELASELDEEGKPKGNIDAAYASLRVAENHLEASRRAYSEAQERVERIKSEKQSHAEKINEYSSVEKNNLDKLKALRNRAFSNNASALSEGIAARLNEAEQARAELLRSMGIEATTISESGEIGGSGGSPWGRSGFSSIDFSGGRGASGGRGGAGEGTSSGTVAAPVGGGLASPTGTGYSGRETGNYESAPEKRDRVDIEHGPESAPSSNPYREQWEDFAKEFSNGEPSADWDSLAEIPFAGNDGEDISDSGRKEMSFSDKVKDAVFGAESSYNAEKYRNSGIQGSFDNVPRARREAVYDLFSNSPSEIKQIANSLSSRLSVDNIKGDDCCHFDPNSSKIKMRADMDDAEYSEVFSHEYGHFADHCKGNISEQGDLGNAMQADLARFDRSNIIGKYNYDNMITELFTSDAAYDRAISDNLSAFFINDPDIVKRFSDEGISYYRHTDPYWAKPGNREAELYANCFSMYSQGNQISCDYMKKYFPNTWAVFKSSL